MNNTAKWLVSLMGIHILAGVGMFFLADFLVERAPWKLRIGPWYAILAVDLLMLAIAILLTLAWERANGFLLYLIWFMALSALGHTGGFLVAVHTGVPRPWLEICMLSGLVFIVLGTSVIWKMGRMAKEVPPKTVNERKE